MSKSIIKKAKAIDKINTSIDVPYYVWRLLGEHNRQITVYGFDQICLGEDYASAYEIREMLEWYVKQFEGAIKWEGEDE